MTFNLQKIEYITIKDYEGLPTLYIENWEVFIKLLKEKKPKSVYHCKNEKREEFLFIENWLGFSYPTQGFITIDDVFDSAKRGFDQCNNKFTVENGVIEERDRYDTPSLKGEVFYSIRKLGYNTFDEYSDAFSKGFGKSDAETYRKITKLGYKKLEDYNNANKQGFKNSNTYYDAIILGFSDNDSYMEYLKLKKIKEEYKFTYFDEAHVYAILNRSSLKKQKKLDEIQEILSEEKPDSYYSTPEWYTESFNRNQTNLEQFLSNNINILNLGIYNKKAKIFENYSDVKILVDGSNVAWSDGSRDAGDKPKVKNIMLVIEKLKSLGPSEVEVLCDANLRKEVEDKQAFDELLKKKIIKQVPSKTDADEFIINYAKKFKARIVTNDTYKDWAQKDEWVKEHANEISIRFMIIDDEVELKSVSGPLGPGFKRQDFDFKGFKNTKYSSRTRFY